ncbi:MAG: PilZ domain-containing protein [Terriglobales bacterium]
MGAASSPALEPSPRRAFLRHPIQVPLDLIVLRSGVPESIPGRCTDICEGGMGAIVAGELAAGQRVAVELRLPNVGVPVRARAVVRHQWQLHCGVEFVGLALEQREMIRYWVYRATASQAADREKVEPAEVRNADGPPVAFELAAQPGRKIRIGRRGLYLLIASLLALAGLGWWQWQRSWNELEKRAPAGESGVVVSPATHLFAAIVSAELVAKVDAADRPAAVRAQTESTEFARCRADCGPRREGRAIGFRTGLAGAIGEL